MPGEDNLGLSWHNYCPEVFFESQGVPGSDVEKCREFSDERNEHALDQGRRMRAATLMSEFGATDNVQALEIDTDGADDAPDGLGALGLQGLARPDDRRRRAGALQRRPRPSTVKRDKLRALVRTYAQATAGTPTEHRVRRHDAADFSMSYTPEPRDQPAHRRSSSARLPHPVGTTSR